MQLSVSATTRPPRRGEEHGREYFFVSDREFSGMVASDAMLEHAEVYGHRYGTPRGPVQACLAEGRDVVFDVDWQGCDQLVRSSLGEHVVSVFILPPSIRELERRLVARGQDRPEVLAVRIERAMDDVRHGVDYDYVLINHDFERCSEELRKIVEAERLRRFRQPGIADHICRLDAEFEQRAERTQAP